MSAVNYSEESPPNACNTTPDLHSPAEIKQLTNEDIPVLESKQI